MMRMAPAENIVLNGPTTPGGKAGKSSRIRMGGWLGLGIGMGGPASPASPSRRCSSGLSFSFSSQQHLPAIADDIRSDQELFFADDEDEPPPSMSLPPSSKAAASAGRMMLSSGFRCDGGRNVGPIQPRRSSVGSVGLPRGSSQKKMENLQREVDLALEYFSQETDNELDDFDGDDYLNRHPEKYQRVEKGYSDDSFTGTAATSLATSVFTNSDSDTEFSDCQFNKVLSLSEQSSTVSAAEPQTRRASGAASSPGGLSLKHKTKSIISLPRSLLPSQTAMNCLAEEDDASLKFENVLSRELNKICISEEQKRNLDFNSNGQQLLRNAMEPFLAVARKQREEARQGFLDTLYKVIQEPPESASRPSTSSEFSFPIGSTYGVPYPTLRNESSFLYDVESFPLAQVLAETLGVKDLSKLHLDHPLKKDKGRLLASLQNRGVRRKFHQCFDSFVTNQIIPLLHSQALGKGVFYTNRHQLQKGKPQSIIYRYQAFPSINIVRPGECSTDPHCDMAQGHSIGNISYHVPLTATFGTNAVYTESRPGREDWHPLCTKSPGLGFQFDGARCLHFNLKNETDITRVSLNFRIAITRAPDCFDDIEFDPDDQLCCPELLKDKFSQENPGFYDEVVVNVGDRMYRSFGPVVTKRRTGISVVG